MHCEQANRDALEADLSGRLQEACDSATQWKEAAERVAAEKAEAEAAHAQAAAALAALQASSSAQLVAIFLRRRTTHCPRPVLWVSVAGKGCATNSRCLGQVFRV